MTLSETIELIEKAIEHATPGPWHDAPGTTTGRIVVAPNTTKAKRRVAALGGPDREANAAYIAACSPDRMREVLAFVRAMEREIAELREALKPFAAIVPVSISTSDGHISSDAFRRARALLGGSDAGN